MPTEIPFGRPWIDDAEKKAVLDVLSGPILTHGPQGKQFEARFQTFMGGGFAATTSSCMASLHLASYYFKLGPGDEVIVPAQTHVATVHAIDIVGATPIFADCNPKTGNMEASNIEPLITPRTKAISVVHYVGIPVDLDPILALAKHHSLAVIEDCALAIGAHYKGQHVGLIGDVGCFSFYPVKHITTGEGGMIVSKNEQILKAIAHFRAFSVDRTHTERSLPGFYDVDGVGLNARMSEMQAAMGICQVDKLPRILAARRRNFTQLKTALLTKTNLMVLDPISPDCQNSHYCLVAVLPPSLAARRNNIMLALKEKGIGTSIYYPQPVPRMQYYREKYKIDPKFYPNATYLSDAGIALPVGPHLTENDMDVIADAMSEILTGVTA
jgi:dTDP-4-amino-4,6-dideoxygalactose transaminase